MRKARLLVLQDNRLWEGCQNGADFTPCLRRSRQEIRDAQAADVDSVDLAISGNALNDEHFRLLLLLKFQRRVARPHSRFRNRRVRGQRNGVRLRVPHRRAVDEPHDRTDGQPRH